MSHNSLSQERPLWVYLEQDPQWIKKIVEEFNIHPVTAEVLASRKFTDLKEIHNFLYAKLPDLHDPDLFIDMDKATARIITALEKKEKILIYGDNDVDGMTATALLTEFFGHIGAEVLFYISSRASFHPNNLKNESSEKTNLSSCPGENETLFFDAIEYASKNQCTLLITVDCGITAVSEIEEATNRNIDVIVSDHHEPTAKLPHCIATLNPKLTNSLYPDREITGVGVAFKLAHAVTNYLVENGLLSSRKIDLKRYLDLVVLGTVADMGALIGENRIFVRYGLRQLRNTKRIGLTKLCTLSEIKLHEIILFEIASKVAPRLNSLGRIGNPNKGVQMLLCRETATAEALTKELEEYNQERQRIERRDSEDLDHYVLHHPEIFKNKAIVLYSHKWHPGIIPIIAARISKKYNRPTLIIAVDKGIGKGSLRTISEFPLLSVLKNNADLLCTFGGHDYAAGIVIKAENIEIFKEKFINFANITLQDQDTRAKLYLNAKISFNELTFDFLESLKLLEPFGNENPPPIFYCDAKQIWPPKVIGKSHLKLYLEQNERVLEGIGFGMAERRLELIKKNLTLHVAFTPHINTFFKKSSIQLHIKDFKINTQAS